MEIIFNLWTISFSWHDLKQKIDVQLGELLKKKRKSPPVQEVQATTAVKSKITTRNEKPSRILL